VKTKNLDTLALANLVTVVMDTIAILEMTALNQLPNMDSVIAMLIAHLSFQEFHASANLDTMVMVSRVLM